MPTSEQNRRGAPLVPGLLAALRSKASAENVVGQRRFGIQPRGEHLGLSMGELRPFTRKHRRDHALALALWDTGVHEARILAAHIADPALLTRAEMERWALDFDSWAVVDNACIHLFRKSPHAFACAKAWIRRPGEYVRRAGFSMIATLAVHANDAPDSVFLGFLPAIRRASSDDRNFVRKAVNWALRQIGKRNPRLRTAALAEARRILNLDTRSARWIARDAIRELKAVRARGGSC